MKLIVYYVVESGRRFPPPIQQKHGSFRLIKQPTLSWIVKITECQFFLPTTEELHLARNLN